MEDKNRSKSKVDTLAKLLPGVGAIVASIFIPFVIHTNAERNRSNQLYAEIVSKREVADSQLRARMFENLIKGFFGDASQQKSDKMRLTLLRLLALNFHESFDLKPLFEELESDLTDKDRNKLKEIAKEIVGKQEAMLSHVEEGMVFRRTLHVGEENGIMVPPQDQAAYKGHRLGIQVTEIGQNDDYARLHVLDFPEGANDIGDLAEVEFKLSYYDTPFIDNTKLFNDTRFAITLHGIVKERKAIDIKIIFFPETYMSSRDRPYLDQMLEQLRKGKKGVM